MNESKFSKVESFELDHTKVKAPFVRKCTVLTGDKGDIVTKFDLRFTQPNESEMQSEGIHTLEHLLATYLRDADEAFASKIIDISPMGCRTGFYMTIWGEWDESVIAQKLTEALKLVIVADSIPANNEIQCGNYRLHSLPLAKKYAKDVLDKGLSDNYMK
ncbi:MAG: S-ribosylhomocysteine lyase [Ruminococcaceae bacterium]|nr:S-ribosylhomocysteine lyase [Oscillospiraceae bacterium]